MPSRLMLYYDARSLEGTTNIDSGATITDIMQAISMGAAPESEWPYDISQFTQQPPSICYVDGMNFVQQDQIQYTNVSQDGNSIKTIIAAGRGVITGMQVFNGDNALYSGQASQTGIVSAPAAGSYVGGHAVVLCGYDDRPTITDGSGNQIQNSLQGYYLVRNSWGTDWGQNGYFWITQDFVHNPSYTSDLWDITNLVNPTQASQIQAKLQEINTWYKPKSA